MYQPLPFFIRIKVDTQNFAHTLDTFLVDSLLTYISSIVKSKVSYFWYLSKSSVEKFFSLILGILKVKLHILFLYSRSH